MMEICEHMATNYHELGEPLDVGTEEQIMLEDWFDRHKFVPFDDAEDIVRDELEHEVDNVTEGQMFVGVYDNHKIITYGENKRCYEV